MAVSIRDIANRVGVSSSAVSLALNNRPGISEATRQKVLSTAIDLGYDKHSSESRKRIKPCLQFVIYKKHGAVVTDTPFFAELSEGISAQAQNNGYTLQIVYFFENQDYESQLYSLRTTPSLGIVLLATEMNHSDIIRFASVDKPIVILDSYFEQGPFDCVVINNEQGAYMATQHLIDMGHTDIGYLHSSVDINNFSERFNGFSRAVISNPKTEDCVKNIIRVSPTIECAYLDMRTYVSDGNRLPKALFADNDIIATSCMRAFKDSGLSLPEDISIVGFDNMPSGEMFRPALSTIHVPKQRLGVLAIDRLISVINGNANEKIKISLSTSLIKRSSVFDNRK